MVQTTLRDYLQDTEDAISSNRVDDALENCRHILRYYPESLEAQRLLGEVFLAQGQLEEAQQTFDWILANDPENVIAYCDRALISERMEDIDTALDCYQQAYELSRGNSQIRQEFNQLSARTGQPDFMFSRAGLARLYMRGDLLTQAIYEWEAVLAASPDRLDARTGLLEAYWREGLYEQVEQLATQILEDIPSCLKALLLLAHVTSIHNMQQAQELIQRAEALDPELILAQELLSDLIASQPNDPFLAFLHKEPIVILEDSGSEVAEGGLGVDMGAVEDSPVVVSDTLSPAISSDPLFGWENLESWSEVDTIVSHQPPPLPAQEPPAYNTWNDSLNAGTWSGNIAGDKAEQEQAFQKIEDDDEPTPTYNGASQEQHPLYPENDFVEPVAVNSWEDASSSSHATTVNPWESEENEPHHPSPPAWLDILTKSEQLPPVEPESFQPPSYQVEDKPTVNMPAAPVTPMEEDFQDESMFPQEEAQEQESTFFFASDESEADMGWPEWLKSLGAATFEQDIVGSPETASTMIPETQQATPFESWSDIEPWSRQVDELLPDTEQETINTLENLESELYAQGFVTLEPGSLSSISQEPTLSSALAQLGSLVSQTPKQEETPPSPTVQNVQTVEPLWPISPRSDTSPPTGTAAEIAEPGSKTLHSEEAAGTTTQSANPTHPPFDAAPPEPPQVLSFAAETIPQPIPEERSNSEVPFIHEPLTSSPDSTERTLEPIFEPTPASSMKAVPETPLVPTYHADALLENELETTMKRPAIRLQPVQHRPSGQREQTLPLNKGRASDRAAAGKPGEGTVSYKERLLSGYQYQLAGDYDDAMQEYRIIIRGAPELLSEVISNVRALLKLAPKYSAGYRVLGDAYMRQGEYLQAMEAYNKALTMAKKAKSQGS